MVSLFRRAEPAPEPAGPTRILVFGDSLSWGWVPQATFIPAERFPPDRQWPRVMGEALGPDYEVIADAPTVFGIFLSLFVSCSSSAGLK